MLEAGVVTAIDNHAAIHVEHAFGPFVAKPAKCRVLYGHVFWVEGIDLDDPAEAVRLVRLLVDVEPVLKFAPRLPEPRYAITLVAFDLRAAEVLRQLAAYKLRIGPEITVEVLFSGEIGAPRCHAAGAIVERAEDARAGWIGTGLKPVMTRRGAVDRREGGERTDAAVIAAVEHRMPLAVLPRNLDDADAMRGHLDLNQFRRHVGEAGQVLTRKTREHHLLIGILVIDAKERAVSARIEQEEGDVVVVVAELLELSGRALPAWAEAGGIREKRIPP